MTIRINNPKALAPDLAPVNVPKRDLAIIRRTRNIVLTIADDGSVTIDVGREVVGDDGKNGLDRTVTAYVAYSLAGAYDDFKGLGINLDSALSTIEAVEPGIISATIADRDAAIAASAQRLAEVENPVPGKVG